MTDDDKYLDVVERIQQAMAVEPFHPSATDVVWLLSQWRRLRGRLAESEAENDQWQEKLAQVWAERDELRAKVARLEQGLIDAGRQLAATEDYWQARRETAP
jgi:hypothetical protein